ncbi:MAG: hypothetical protein KBB21_37685 [Nannocystaceae bacterium]|nr:hypothetical protein [Nannocystaceae bacterium]
MPETTPQPKPPTDEVAAAIHAIVVVLGAAGLIDRLGLTPDQVAVLISGAMVIAGIVRAVWLRTRPSAAIDGGS